MDLSNPSFIGKALIASGIFWIIQMLSVTLLYIVGQPFGAISDLTNALTVLSIIPFALAIYRMNQSIPPMLNLIALLIGIAGILAVTLASFMIIFGRINFFQYLPPVLLGFSGLGLMLIGILSVARNQELLPANATFWGIVIGLGLLSFGGLVAVDVSQAFNGGWRSLFANPFIYPALIFGPFFVLGFPIWAIWLGRLLRSGKLAAFS